MGSAACKERSPLRLPLRRNLCWQQMNFTPITHTPLCERGHLPDTVSTGATGVCSVPVCPSSSPTLSFLSTAHCVILRYLADLNHSFTACPLYFSQPGTALTRLASAASSSLPGRTLTVRRQIDQTQAAQKMTDRKPVDQRRVSQKLMMQQREFRRRLKLV